MRRATILVLAFAILLPVTAASAQKRRRAPVKRSPPVSNTAAIERRAGAERVAEQIKTLTQFLYLFGGIAKGIEAADLAAQNRETSSAAVEQTRRNKAMVKNSLANVRVGLENLETEFSSKAGLRQYSLHVAGVADLAAHAEQQAAAGQLDPAGKSLLKVVNRLTDALVAMRGA